MRILRHAPSLPAAQTIDASVPQRWPWPDLKVRGLNGQQLATITAVSPDGTKPLHSNHQLPLNKNGAGLSGAMSMAGCWPGKMTGLDEGDDNGEVGQVVPVGTRSPRARS